jgi:hypothetical protein
MSGKIGVPPPLATQVHGKAEHETNDTFIPPPDFHQGVVLHPRSRSPPPPPSADAPVAT